jgi:hypothetical protein
VRQKSQKLYFMKEEAPEVYKAIALHKKRPRGPLSFAILSANHVFRLTEIFIYAP